MKIEEIDFSQIEGYNLPLFLNKTWIDTFSNINQVDFKLYAVKKNNTINAIFGIFHKDRKIVQIPLSYYNSLVFFIEKRKIKIENNEKKNRILVLITKFLKKNYSSIVMNLTIDFDDSRPFFWNNITVNNRYTFVIDLNNFDSANYKHSTRKAIAKAKKMDVEITNEFDFDSFWKLNSETFARQNSKFPYKEKQCRYLLENLYKENLLIQYNAKMDGLVKSSRIVVRSENEKKIYDFLSASDPDSLSSGINSLLVDKIIMDFKNKYNQYDLCGANIESIARFKSGFGGDLKQFFQICWYKNKIRKVINNLR